MAGTKKSKSKAYAKSPKMATKATKGKASTRRKLSPAAYGRKK